MAVATLAETYPAQGESVTMLGATGPCPETEIALRGLWQAAYRQIDEARPRSPSQRITLAIAQAADIRGSISAMGTAPSDSPEGRVLTKNLLAAELVCFAGAGARLECERTKRQSSGMRSLHGGIEHFDSALRRYLFANRAVQSRTLELYALYGDGNEVYDIFNQAAHGAASLTYGGPTRRNHELHERLRDWLVGSMSEIRTLISLRLRGFNGARLTSPQEDRDGVDIEVAHKKGSVGLQIKTVRGNASPGLIEISRAGVFEVGVRSNGHKSDLCRLARPDAGAVIGIVNAQLQIAA